MPHKKETLALQVFREISAYSAVVEVRRIELLSENTSAKGTTSVVCDLNFPHRKFTDKLFGLVAS